MAATAVSRVTSLRQVMTLEHVRFGFNGKKESVCLHICRKSDYAAAAAAGEKESKINQTQTTIDSIIMIII